MTKFIHAQRFFSLILALQFALVAIHTECVSADTLDEQLSVLRGKGKGFDTDTEKLEQEYLNLLNQYNDPKDIGRIYAALTDMYCQSGLTDPFSAAKYAQKALEYPQDPPTKIRLHCNWGDALRVQNRGATGSELAAARREVIRPYLYGIKIALDYEIPDERVGLPIVGRFHAARGTEIYEQLVKKHEEQVAARQRAKFTNDMVFRRDGCISQTVSLYSKKPFATDELRQMATEILGDKDAVEKLISKVDAVVKEKLQKELGEISEEVFQELSAGSLKDISPAVEIPEIPAEKKAETTAATQSEADMPEPPPPTSGLSPVVLVVAAAVIVLAAAILIFWVKRVKSANK